MNLHGLPLTRNSQDPVDFAVLTSFMKEVQAPGRVRSRHLHFGLTRDLEAPSGAPYSLAKLFSRPSVSPQAEGHEPFRTLSGDAPLRGDSPIEGAFSLPWAHSPPAERWGSAFSLLKLIQSVTVHRLASDSPPQPGVLGLR